MRTLEQVQAEYVELLKAKLKALGGDLPKRRGRKPGAKRAKRVVAKKVGGKRKASSDRKAAMVRQGKYIAAVRQLREADRPKVKAVLKSKGWRAAMAEAKRLANGRTARIRVPLASKPRTRSIKPVANAAVEA